MHPMTLREGVVLLIWGTVCFGVVWAITRRWYVKSFNMLSGADKSYERMQAKQKAVVGKTAAFLGVFFLGLFVGTDGNENALVERWAFGLLFAAVIFAQYRHYSLLQRLVDEEEIKRRSSPP